MSKIVSSDNLVQIGRKFLNNLSSVAVTGSYTDLSNRPDLTLKENISNKTTVVNSGSTDTQYPSAKAVNTAVEGAKSYTDSAISDIEKET